MEVALRSKSSVTTAHIPAKLHQFVNSILSVFARTDRHTQDTQTCMERHQ